MSTITSMDVMSPLNKLDSCPAFVIEDRQKDFAFRNVTVIGNEYTLSFWVKTDTDNSIAVNNSRIETNSVWTHHVMTYVADSPNLMFIFNSAGVYYIYHLQLELGNRATDWRPAPEDADDRITNLRAGGRNLIRRSTDLSFNNYYFSGTFVAAYDGAGDIAVISGGSATADSDGNVTLRGSAKASHDGNGNVTIV